MANFMDFGSVAPEGMLRELRHHPSLGVKCLGPHQLALDRFKIRLGELSRARSPARHLLREASVEPLLDQRHSLSLILPTNRGRENPAQLGPGQDLAEHVKHPIAKGFSLHLELAQDRLKHRAFSGVGGHEIPQMTGP
ncbi:hypothetical protein, partial [Ornithinicoccus hortensis]|uniref:hypothetical protein n=1 Tax=Ornithinicoccus hortensis TaxID=82346 RepID=UPI0031D119D5